MKTFSQLVKQIGLDESSGTIWDKIMGHALTGKGILKFSYPGDSAKISVTIKTASELLGAYLSLSTSRQQQFTEMINRNAVSFWAMSEWAKDMGVTHISVGESTELEEAKNLDALWQKFLKKIKMRPFDRKERARDKEEKKKIRKYQKMVGITSSVEHLDEKIYDPMYYDAGMNNISGMNKFIDAMTKAKITVTSPRKGVAEVFPKEGSDRQKIFKAAERYGMIAIDESVELGEMLNFQQTATGKKPKIKYAKIMKGIRDSQGPFSVVAIKGKKVVWQKNSIKNSKMLPIHVNQAAFDYPGATISIESEDGKILNTFKESVEHLDEKVKGWIAIYNGKELEIPNDGKVKGIYGAKQLAIKHFDIPMSKWGKLAISIAESVELDEGKQLELLKKYGNTIMKMWDKEGKSSDEIAKKLKLNSNDTKTLKDMMDESVKLDEGKMSQFWQGVHEVLENEMDKKWYREMQSANGGRSLDNIISNTHKQLYGGGDPTPKDIADAIIAKYGRNQKEYMKLSMEMMRRNESVELDEVRKGDTDEIVADAILKSKKLKRNAKDKDIFLAINDELEKMGLSSTAIAWHMRNQDFLGDAFSAIRSGLKESIQLDEKVKLTSLKSAVKYVEQSMVQNVSGTWKTNWKFKGNSVKSKDWSIEKVGKLFNWEYHGEGHGKISSFMSADGYEFPIEGREEEAYKFAYAVDEITAELTESNRWRESVELDEKDNTAAVAKQVKQEVKKYTSGKLTVKSKGGKTRFIMVMADNIDNKLRKMILDIAYPKANVRGDDMDNISYGNISDKIISVGVDVWVKALGLKESTINEAETLHWDELDKDEREDFLKHAKLHKKLMTKDWRELDSRIQKSLQKMITKTTEGEFALEESITDDTRVWVITSFGKVIFVGGSEDNERAKLVADGLAHQFKTNTKKSKQNTDYKVTSATEKEAQRSFKTGSKLQESVNESKSKDAILDVLDAIEKLGMKSTPKNIAKETKLDLKFVEDAIEFWIEDDKIESMGFGNRIHYMMKEEIANSSSGGGVSGLTPDTVGGDSRIMKMHRREKKKKKKNDELEESIEKDIKNVNLIIRDNFCGHPVFQVTEDEFNKCKSRRAKNERWSNYFDEDSSSGLKIKSYSHKNPSKPIIVQNERTGEMVFYRRRLNDNRLKHNVKSKRLSEQE
jgi:hypothetical protein